MRTDKNYKPPAGFEPYLSYENTKDGEPIPNYGILKLHSRDFLFNLIKKVPALPLKSYGKEWHTGWDIPTLWAIDSNNQPWFNDAHGGALNASSKEEMISLFENEHERNKVRILLGLEPEEPSWMKQAKAAGWTPPKDSK